MSDIEAKLDHKPSKSIATNFRRSNPMDNEVIISNGMTPTLEYELLRRRIRTNTMEMYNYVNSELGKIWKKVQPHVPELGPTIDAIGAMANEHKHSLINDMDRLRRIDGYEDWRRKEAESLSDLVQRRLTYLQNPDDCSKARKLVCRLNKVNPIFFFLFLTKIHEY